MRSVTRTVLLAAIVGFALLVAAPASAQRTGDHIVPAIETVCDDDPYSFGLCNAYCEALDCHCPTPGTPECTALGTPRACSNLLKNYKKKSGGAIPPCGCPCGFDAQADFDALLAAGNAEFDPAVIDVDATFQQFCGNHGPSGELAYVAEAATVPEIAEDTPQTVRLFYWIETDPATCNEVGGGMDQDVATLNDPSGQWDYGPFFSRQLPDPPPLSASEVQACGTLIDFLCNSIPP